jgi:flagellar biosynthesis anti-sigma factor FlgM
MKIATDSQQPAVAQQAVQKKAAKPEAAGVREKTGAKRPRKGDTVQLSGSIDAEIKARQAAQARRVESIKALVQDGKYQVESRKVAEKMVSRSSDG